MTFCNLEMWKCGNLEIWLAPTFPHFHISKFPNYSITKSFAPVRNQQELRQRLPREHLPELHLEYRTPVDDAGPAGDLRRERPVIIGGQDGVHVSLRQDR